MSSIDPVELLKAAEHAAREAGTLLLRMQPGIAAQEKGPRDLVTEADLAAQKTIESLVRDRYPDHAFLGEESPNASASSTPHDTGYRWIVDPLDGTTNYTHGLPSYAVSIAVEFNGQVEVGVVFDPVLNECFRAARNHGAWLNQTPINPSDCRALATAMVVASFSANVPRGSLEIARFVEVLHEVQAVRRLGSAALNLCYVAAGRIDAYWATSVKSWDVAAGQLIVTESGGHLTGIGGAPFQLHNPHLIAAATPELHRDLRQVLDRIQ